MLKIDVISTLNGKLLKIDEIREKRCNFVPANR